MCHPYMWASNNMFDLYCGDFVFCYLNGTALSSIFIFIPFHISTYVVVDYNVNTKLSTLHETFNKQNR